MAEINYTVVSKGEYDNGKNPPRVYPKHYIFLKNKKEKYLSLRFFNGLDADLTYVEFILFQLDSAGNVIKKFRVCENVQRGRSGRTFSLGSGIKLSDKCVDFKIRMVKARCGKYSYFLKHNEAYPIYMLEKKWNYDPERAGYYSDQTVKSGLSRDYILIKLLAFVVLLAVVAICFEPVISAIIKLRR